MKLKRGKIALKYTCMLFVTFTVAIIALCQLCNYVLQVNAKQVVISDNNLKLTYETSQKDVESFLKAHDIALGENDSVNVGLDEAVSDGMVIEIKRAVDVTLVIDGTETKIATSSETVSDFLYKQNITLEKDDDINVNLSDTIRENMRIEIRRCKYDTIVQEEPINFETIYEDTSTLKKGVTQLKQEGVNGRKKITYKVKYLAGREACKEVINTEIIREPQNRIYLNGCLETFTSPGGKTYNVKKTLTMSATGYTNSLADTGKTEGHPLYGITRSGLKTTHGTVAVDPKVIPLMTKLYVEGYGEAIAADTGSAIKGNKIDLFFDTREQALNFGRRNLKVYILE